MRSEPAPSHPSPSPGMAEAVTTLSVLLNTYWELRRKEIPATLTTSSYKGGMKTTLMVKNPSSSPYPSSGLEKTNSFPSPQRSNFKSFCDKSINLLNIICFRKQYLAHKCYFPS